MVMPPLQPTLTRSVRSVCAPEWGYARRASTRRPILRTRKAELISATPCTTVPAATHVSSAVSEPCSEAATHPPDRQLGEGGEQQQPPPAFSSGGDGGHDPEGGR